MGDHKIEKTVFQSLPAGPNGNVKIVLDMVEAKNVFYQKTLKGYLLFEEKGMITTETEENAYEYVSWFFSIFMQIQPHLESYLSLSGDNQEFKKFREQCDKLLNNKAERAKFNLLDFGQKFDKLQQMERTLQKILRELGYTKEKTLDQLAGG